MAAAAAVAGALTATVTRTMDRAEADLSAADSTMDPAGTTNMATIQVIFFLWIFVKSAEIHGELRF